MSEAPLLERGVSSWAPDAAPGAAERARDPFPRATWLDLIRRTLRASSGESGPAELAWAASILTVPELAIWSAQSAYDRIHSLRVARRVEVALAGTPCEGDSRWPAAALMHDVGKLAARLTLFERIAANLLRSAIGADRARRWASRATGRRRRIGAYLSHGEIGGAMIRAAGGREQLATWAELHQTHPGGPAPGVPAAVVAALLAADRA